MSLYESTIRGLAGKEVSPVEFANALVSGIKTENEPLNRQNILSQLETIFWKLLTPVQRKELAPEIEASLWSWIDDPDCPEEAKSSYYKTVVAIATTDSTVERLFQIWNDESDVGGVPLAEKDFMNLAYELAIRLPDKSDEILGTQLIRMKNEDRKKRFEFVSPALSPDSSTRDAFFDSLGKVENRRPERWALEALEFLHHPLRANESEKYILPSLELLEEIQLTGDIFFPKRWLVATMSGHRSKSAAKVVQSFLLERPEYPSRLKNKILQAADLLFRVGLSDN
jgi:aminopeptidase N